MSYLTLTDKQVVVLETLAEMTQEQYTDFTSWGVAWKILRCNQTAYRGWNPGIKCGSMERSVAGVLACLERKGLVESYFSAYNGSQKGGLNMWSLSLLGVEVAG
jgi:hypothetical protein